ncbi:MAG: DUF4175 domain-containing protein [Alphaproteobacteria bacterium]|nr:DUF4175 domain-containing protein [Alphaproteobacteria bacterium]
MSNQPQKKNIIGPFLLAIIGIAAVGATVIWKDKTTEFLLSLNHSDESSPTQHAQQDTKPDATLAPPEISWVAPPLASAQNRIAMSFKVSASAPLRSVTVSITPVIKMPGIEVDKEIMSIATYLAGRKTLDWDGQIDLTGSLLAGTPVVLQIVAQDGDKREGTSETVSLTLPEHAFNNPVAKTIYDLRKSLREDPQNKRLETLRGLAVLLQQRDNFEHNELTLLTLRSAAVRIALDKTNDGLRTALDLLWHAAVLFEDSHPSGVAKS